MSIIDSQFDSDSKTDYTYPPVMPNDIALQMLAKAFCRLEGEDAWRQDLGHINRLSYRNNIVEAIIKHLESEDSSYLVRAKCCEWLLSSSADLQENYKKDLKKTFLQTLEPCASRSPVSYLDYLDRTQAPFIGLVSKEDRLRRSGKCLAQIRGRIKRDDMGWRFADYRKVLDQLGIEGEAVRCLTTLLMAFRQLKAGSANSSVQVQWGMCMSDVMQTDNHESAFQLAFSELAALTVCR